MSTTDTKAQPTMVGIPSWALKFLGFLISTLAFGAISWASWMTVTVIEIRTKISESYRNSINISSLEDDLIDTRIQLGRLEERIREVEKKSGM